MNLFNSGTLNFAHRGFTANAPENTLGAIRAAIELGVDGIEFDVRTCKSGEVLVFHDAGLERMTDGKGMVKNLTLTEVRQFKIKTRVGETAEVIPTLEEVLELVDGKIGLNVEIKADALPRGHKIEEKVIGLLKKYNVEKQTVISSFHPLSVRKLRKVDESILRGFLFEKKSIFGKLPFFFTRILGANAMHMGRSMASTDFINKALGNSYSCVVWTVNSPELMKRLISYGVDVIITDKPDVLKNIKMGESYA